MRRSLLTESELCLAALLALTLTGCGSPKATESAAPATEPTTPAAAPATTAAAPETAAAAPATEAAPAEAGGGTATAPPAKEMAPVTPEARISAKLVEAFGDDAKTINITLVDGKAILTGKVGERSTQELAEEVALYFPEVKGVDNQLTAAKDRGLGKGVMKDEVADAKLETSAKKALSAEIGEAAKDVEVEAAAGVVSLRGTVPDDARVRLALDAMKKVENVKKVVNLLRTK